MKLSRLIEDLQTCMDEFGGDIEVCSEYQEIGEVKPEFDDDGIIRVYLDISQPDEE